MKILKTFSLSLALTALSLHTVSLQAGNHSVIYSDIPVKTVFIKHPQAADANKFFSTGTVFSFEVYKISKEDAMKLINSLRQDASVESINQGLLTGDYQAFTLTLKTPKNKEWFMSEFKKAGLNTIKINNNPIVDVDKI